MPSPRYAFISVYEKEGLERLAPAVNKAGLEIISLGGTATAIEGLGIPVMPSEEFVDCGIKPDMAMDLDEREVREIRAASLAQTMCQTDEDLAATNRSSIDLVYINLLAPRLITDQAGRIGYHRDKGGELMLHAALEGARTVLTSPHQVGPYVEHLGRAPHDWEEGESHRQVLALEALDYLDDYAAQVRSLGRLGARQLRYA